MKGIKSGQSFNGEMDDEEMEIRRQRAEECYKDFLYALGFSVANCFMNATSFSTPS